MNHILEVVHYLVANPVSSDPEQCYNHANILFLLETCIDARLLAAVNKSVF